MLGAQPRFDERSQRFDVEVSRGRPHDHRLCLVYLEREIVAVDDRKDASGGPGESLVAVDQRMIPSERVNKRGHLCGKPDVGIDTEH